VSAPKKPLAGEVAIVTGASRGVGRAIAEALAAGGSAVALAARTKADVDAAAAAIRRDGGEAMAMVTDVREAGSVGALIAEAEAKLGPPTLLVNNAGSWQQIGPLADADPEVWWTDVEASLRGTFLCTRAVLAGMLRRGTGRIVNVSSYAGIAARPYAIAYACAKAALLRFTDSLAAELSETGVLAFAITPGFVRTDMVERLASSTAGRRFLPDLAERQDAVEPERAGRLVVEIASGRLDPLAGRFLHVLDDYEALLNDAERIRRDDLYVLRLRK
jgi:NAD(P)-dependent dehydrogenase (short-subunit alcohol dehydrogenase family)